MKVAPNRCNQWVSDGVTRDDRTQRLARVTAPTLAAAQDDAEHAA